MKILFFGADCERVRKALQIAIEKKITVVGCVVESYTEKFLNFTKENAIILYKYDDISQMMSKNELPVFDYTISYSYPKRIRREFIDYVHGKIINFHPAPVQVHKGVAACCYCLLNGYKKWGVTAHYVVPEFDAGDIIKQRFFDVEENITAIEAEKKQQQETLILFSEILDLLVGGAELPRIKQDEGIGLYYSRKQLNEDKNISLSDSPEEIDRKINALWFPPYHGASIVINGKRYSLVNDEILKKLAD